MVYSYVENKSMNETRTISLNFRDFILSQHKNVGEQETNFDAFTSHHYSLFPHYGP